MNIKLRAAYRLLMVALVITAIISQLLYSQKYGAFDPGNFFSYFTIQSNIIAAIVLAYLAINLLRNKKETRVAGYLRGAATFYMFVTGVITAVLLNGVDLQTGLVWVDTVLHKLFPIVMLLAWVLDPPDVKLKFSKALLWILYPIAYLIYSLIRGSIVGWYPYPFINVATHGLETVLIVSTVIALVAVPFCLLIARLPVLLRKLGSA